MEVAELKKDIEQLKALLLEKENTLRSLEQARAIAEEDAFAQMLKEVSHPLICPHCGISLNSPPSLNMKHMGCYTAGYWRKGYRSQNDWIKASIENGEKITNFFSNSEKQSK